MGDYRRSKIVERAEEQQAMQQQLGRMAQEFRQKRQESGGRSKLQMRGKMALQNSLSVDSFMPASLLSNRLPKPSAPAPPFEKLQKYLEEQEVARNYRKRDSIDEYTEWFQLEKAPSEFD